MFERRVFESQLRHPLRQFAVDDPVHGDALRPVVHPDVCIVCQAIGLPAAEGVEGAFRYDDFAGCAVAVGLDVELGFRRHGGYVFRFHRERLLYGGLHDEIRLSVEVNRAFRSKIVAVSDAAAAVYPCLRTVGQNDVFLRSALRRFGHVGQDGHVEMFAEALIQQV